MVGPDQFSVQFRARFEDPAPWPIVFNRFRRQYDGRGCELGESYLGYPCQRVSKLGDDLPIFACSQHPWPSNLRFDFI